MTSLRRFPKADNPDDPPVKSEYAARQGFFKIILKLIGYVLIHKIINRN